jgi:two-component system CheB/CheR fusion protein
VDTFLNSLAIDKGRNGIGIILSGTGPDGTAGIENLKKAGGMTIAQQPQSCLFAAMPVNAISTGCVDHVLLPSEMPTCIIQYIDSRLAAEVSR